jgi:hypothetical protein
MTSHSEDPLVPDGGLRLASAVGLVGQAAGSYTDERVYPPEGALVAVSVADPFAFVAVVLG